MTYLVISDHIGLKNWAGVRRAELLYISSKIAWYLYLI